MVDELSEQAKSQTQMESQLQIAYNEMFDYLSERLDRKPTGLDLIAFLALRLKFLENPDT